MKIRSLEATLIPLTLIEPYTITYQTVSAVTNILLTLKTDAGTVYGITGPDEAIIGETIDSVMEAVSDIAEPFLVGEDIESVTVREKLFEKFPSAPAVKALFDTAFHDHDSKKVGMPLYRFLGSTRQEIATAVTIFILPIAETVKKVAYWKGKGFKHFKIKGGLCVQDDIDRLYAVRHFLGNEAPIIFDANQGYSYEESVHFCRETRDLNLTVLEQPICKSDPMLLGDLYEATHAPLMADECLCSKEDIYKLLDKTHIPFINIKLMKIGRFECAKVASEAAAQKNTQIIFGCMDECALLIAASLHLSLSLPNVPFVDLDSFLEYSDDPTAGTVLVEGGLIRTNDKPGLGFGG